MGLYTLGWDILSNDTCVSVESQLRWVQIGPWVSVTVCILVSSQLERQAVREQQAATLKQSLRLIEQHKRERTRKLNEAQSFFHLPFHI